MAASGRGGEFSIAVVEPTAQADASGVEMLRRGAGDVQRRDNGEEQGRQMMEGNGSAETVADDEVERKLMKGLNGLVLCVALLEWAGNAVGTLATLWATVVLLGGFCSMLSPTDFWFSTVMIFIEATRVFIRNDASVNQWLFGSTRAFRWTDFSFPRMLVRSKHGSLIAAIIGAGITAAPVHLRPEIIAGILKVAILVIVSQLLTRLWGPGTRQVACTVLGILLAFALCGGIYGVFKLAASLHHHRVKQVGSNPSKKDRIFISLLPIFGMMMPLLPLFARNIMLRIAFMRKPFNLLCFKLFTALVLACLPLLQVISALYYYGFTIVVVAAVLLTLGTSETSNQVNGSCTSRLLQIVDTVLPILFFWSLMFPLPGISLKASFYILAPVLLAVLIGNLQIPVAVLQLVLSVLRLRSLLGHHRYDYHPLPDGAGPNFVPSIVFFFMLELCQGSASIVAIFLGVIFLLFRRSLVRSLGFTGEWGAKAIDFYYHQAYQARTENGLFASEKNRPSLESFAIKSLGCTSREMQIVGLRIIDKYLQREDAKSNNKIITEIVKDSTNIVTKITELISHLLDEQKSGNSGTGTQRRENPCFSLNFVRRLISPLIGEENSGDTDTRTQQKEAVCLSLKFVRSLATEGGRMGARFRHELSGNPFFLNSLESILDLEDCGPELWKPVIYIIAKLAWDKSARQEIGSSQEIVTTLIRAFVRPDGVNLCVNNDRSLRMAAGEALANLPMVSTVNCWAILLVEPGQNNLIENLVNMLENDYYICVAANLLYNLCAHSGDKLIDLGADTHLKSALPKVVEIIMTKEREQLQAALCIASQIGSVTPEYFAHVLESDTTDAAALVKRLVDTLNSNMEPCPEYPRMRRVLVEVVITIVDLCPRYISIFKQNGATDALDMVKQNPSRFDKYRVTESLPMRDLLDKAKRLIHQEALTPDGQPGDHA